MKILQNAIHSIARYARTLTSRSLILYVFLMFQLLRNQFTHQVDGRLLNLCALCFFLHSASFIVQFTSHSVLSLCPHADTLFHVCIAHLHMFFKHCVFDCQIIVRLVSLRVAVMCELCFPSSLDNPPILSLISIKSAVSAISNLQFFLKTAFSNVSCQ